MKKIFCLFVSIFVTLSIFANLQGHFFVDLSSQNIAITNITDIASFILCIVGCALGGIL